ncbi:MAG: cardiolipin synthase B [Deltaproteobacteria bacterium]|nr:cardiolipin synthase B [Deltaproteobacteria bacterium]
MAIVPSPARIPRRYREPVSERKVGGNDVVLLRNGTAAFPTMLDAIASAREQVLLEMYWFGSDGIGRRFARALEDKARDGVEVAVIHDSVGSIDAAPEMFDDMRAAGVRVVEFNPVAPWQRRFRLDRLNRRDHRKILVVDGTIGFVGGINIGDPWHPDPETGACWRDDAIRVEGPAVESLGLLFAHTWVGQGERPLGRHPTGPAHEGSGTNVRVLGEYGVRNRREIRRAYLYRVWHSRKRVWIANSYFVPDRVVRRALVRAARRGVDVRVLVPAQSDIPAVYYAGRATYDRLMRHGVRIFEWQRNVLHAKTAVVDGLWSTVGSYNLDYRSFRYNLEVSVAIEDEAFATAMEASYEQDFAESAEVRREDFRFRSLSDRLLERVCYFFRKLL